MEKEVLRKIYLLKEIKPTDNWVSSIRAELTAPKENDRASFISVFVRPGFAFAGAMVLIFAFGLLQPAMAPLYDGAYTIITERDENEDGVMIAEVPDSEDVVAEREVEERFYVSETSNEDLAVRVNEISSTLKEIQKKALEEYVLANIVSEEGAERRSLTEEEIARYLLSDMERVRPGYNEEEREMFTEAKEAFEMEIYDTVLDMYLLLR